LSRIYAELQRFCRDAAGCFGREQLKLTVNWLAVVTAASVVLMIGLVIATVWNGIGDSEISGAGWLAMGLGVIVTLALGIGLMALMFISNRRGHDEISRDV
jgi:hypothetical protein